MWHQHFSKLWVSFARCASCWNEQAFAVQVVQEQAVPRVFPSYADLICKSLKQSGLFQLAELIQFSAG